jgi:hypothetical protein
VSVVCSASGSEVKELLILQKQQPAFTLKWLIILREGVVQWQMLPDVLASQIL